MGHIGPKPLASLGQATIGLKDIPSLKELENYSIKLADCPVCIQAKLSTKKGKNPLAIGENYLDLLYSDLCGPITPRTNRGNRYIASFIDSKTRYISSFLLSTKDTLFQAFKDFIRVEENISNNTLKRIHSDNGGEYKNTALGDFLKERGVKVTFSSAYAHEQNGIAERFNRTLFNKVRALLIDSKSPGFLWGEAAEAVVYLYNRTPHSSLVFKTPFEARFGRKPDISNIRIWGSRVYRKDYTPDSKLSPRAKLGVLIGFGSNSWKIFDLETRRTTWSRDCAILEAPIQDPRASIADQPSSNSNIQLESENSENYLNDEENSQLGTQKGGNLEPVSVPLEKSIEIRIPEATIDKSDYIVYEEVLYTAEGEPESYLEAINSQDSQKWLESMKIELDELLDQNVWDLVEKPENRQVLKGRWVYRKKTNAQGETTRFKSRWVCKGFQQKYGLDYLDTWANTIRPSIYRALFGIASSLGLFIYQWDIKLAFIHSPIDEVIYVEQPTGFSQNNGLVCKLNKALYGLKQAPRAWQQFLSKVLVKLGFKNLSDIDPSLYIRGSIIIGTHVDDLLVLLKNSQEAVFLRKELERELQVQDLGEISYYLGIEVLRNPQALVLTQRGFIKKNLARFNLEDLIEAPTPMSQGIILEANREKASLETTRLYQQQIGSLMYLMTQTRPDIAYPLGHLARYMSNPNKTHFIALNRLWGYLKRTINYGLFYHTQPKTNTRLVGYCDADWGGDRDIRKSTTGYLFLIGGTPVSWASKLQKTVALSTCEAEYMALREAIKEQAYLKIIFNLLPILSPHFDNRIYTDSQSAIDLARNPIFHQRTKHIDIQYHYIRESILEKRTDLYHVPTEQQLADSFTKAISIQKWPFFLENINLKAID